MLLVYYWIHKPLTPRLVAALGGGLLDFASALLMLVIAGGIGRLVLARTFSSWNHTLTRAERLAGEALIGLGILSLAIFLVGLINLSVWSMLSLLLVVGGLGQRGLRAWLAQAWASGRSLNLRNRWAGGLAIFIVGNLIMAWFMALSPPTMFDTLTYHLVGAKLWLAEGRFTALQGNHFFGFPQLLNTLYTGQMALLLGRMTGAASLHWLVGVLTLLAAGGYAARRFTALAGLLAGALLLAATSIWLQFSYAYVDLFPAACGILTFIACDEWRRSAQRGWLVLAGVFVGLAMSSKYNAAWLGVASGCYVAVYSWRTGTQGVLQNGLIFTLTASLVVAPWLVRNLFFYDNPFYPFGALAGEWDALSREWYTSAQSAALRETPAFVLPIFLTPTFLGVDGAGLFDATIGPLFLMLIPFLWLTWRSLETEQKDSLRGLIFWVVVFHLLWLIAAGISGYGAQTRLMFPMFGWLAVLAAASVSSLPKLPPLPINLAWMIRAVVAIVLALTLLDHVAGRRPRDGEGVLEGTTLQSHFIESHALDYIFGVLSRKAFLEDRLGWHVVAMEEASRLPKGSHVLFLWETRSLYCDERRITCEEDTILLRWWHDRRSVGDGSAAAILESWRARGVTHVLIWESGRDYEFRNNRFFTQADKDEWQAMDALLGEPLWQGADSYSLYAITSN